jgi:hypothetical protein
MNNSVVLIAGDLSYADGYPKIWDAFGQLLQTLGSTTPIMTVGGNHEAASAEAFLSYKVRYPSPNAASNSPHFSYYGYEVGPVHVIALCSYAGFSNTSMQYQWLQNHLATKIDRVRTPWLIVVTHVPLYSSNSGHYKEGEAMRRSFEPMLVAAGVDLVITGHIHAYERISPVINFQLDTCGTNHMVLGDAGNYEASYTPWLMNVTSKAAPTYSAFREASFGVAGLTIINATHAMYKWHRVACDKGFFVTNGASASYYSTNTDPDGDQDFSDNCISANDNSVQAMVTVDSHIIIRPSAAMCPNKWAGSYNRVTSAIKVTQTISGIDTVTASTLAFQTDLASALTASLNLGPSAVVTISSVKNSALRRSLLANSAVVTYQVAATDVSEAVIMKAAIATVSTGSLSYQLISKGYTSASAAARPSTTDVSPTAAPNAIPASMSSYASSCFAGSESVSLESGDIKAISDVKVGDSVLVADASGKTLYSEVIYVPHGTNMENSEFVHINTENKDLKMTKNHILPSGTCGSTLPLVYASKVSVGDCVQTVSGQEIVTSIKIVKGEGVYTIVTNEEYIVVNGIIASSFGANHMMANLFYNIHRFLYAISPSLLSSSIMHTANERLGMMIPFFGPSAKM